MGPLVPVPLSQRNMNSIWRRRTSLAVDAVVSDEDLIGLILSQGMGPASFTAASLVCKTWLRVCRSDERVLRGAALYQGGLTKGAFMKLFAITSKVADTLPRSSHQRRGGGSFFLYRGDAVDAILAAGGIKEWQKRLRFRAEHPSIVGWPQQADCFRRASWREERLHAQQEERLRVRASQRAAWRLVQTGG